MVGAYIDWRVQSKCSSLGAVEYDAMFFPDHGRTILKAKEFCSDCPVRDICLEWALTEGVCGIWAGTNETERKKMLRFRDQLTSTANSAVYQAARVVRKTRKKITKHSLTFH